MSYLQTALTLDGGDSLVYSHVIHGNGDYVIRTGASSISSPYKDVSGFVLPTIPLTWDKRRSIIAERLLILGIKAGYKMEGGKESMGLVAGLPMSYLQTALTLESFLQFHS